MMNNISCVFNDINIQMNIGSLGGRGSKVSGKTLFIGCSR